MYLSEQMQSDLTRWYADGARPSDQRVSFRIRGRWYCPADGRQLRTKDGTICCPTCGRCLTPFVQDLIDHHRHQGTDLKPRFWVAYWLFVFAVLEVGILLSAAAEGGYRSLAVAIVVATGVIALTWFVIVVVRLIRSSQSPKP